MKVFLSCSGEMGRSIARVLRDWLPKVIQEIKPFISEDIDKGEPWFEKIMGELKDTQYGIICITQYNFKAPWLYFESGAITEAIDKPCISPFLFRVDKSKIIGRPLEHFQITENKKDDIFKLLCSINDRLAREERLSQPLLEQEFETWWPTLRDNLNGIPDSYEAETETGIKWLYTAEDLARRQSGIKCKDIWVITPDLYKRTIDPKVKDLVQTNIERGVTYTFITEKSSKTDDATVALNNIFSSKPQQLNIKPIDEKDFYRLAVSDYIIINPGVITDHNQDKGYDLFVFLELPVEEIGYWIEVKGEAAIHFVERFSCLVKPERDASHLSPG
jgi:hypothetical protein